MEILDPRPPQIKDGKNARFALASCGFILDFSRGWGWGMGACSGQSPASHWKKLSVM